MLKDYSDRFYMYNSTGTVLHFLRFGYVQEFFADLVVHGNKWQPDKELVAIPPDLLYQHILIYSDDESSVSTGNAVKPWLWLPLICGLCLMYK